MRSFVTMVLCFGIVLGATTVAAADAREIDVGIAVEAAPEGHLGSFHCHGPTLTVGRTGAAVTCYKAIQSGISWALVVECYRDHKLQGFPTIVSTSYSRLNGHKVKYCPSHKPFAYGAGVAW